MTVMMARLVMMVMMMTMLMTVMPQVIDHEEDNLSDKETYSKNIPAIGKNLLIVGRICPNYV